MLQKSNSYKTKDTYNVHKLNTTTSKIIYSMHHITLGIALKTLLLSSQHSSAYKHLLNRLNEVYLNDDCFWYYRVMMFLVLFPFVSLAGIRIAAKHQRVYRERPSQDVGDPTPTAGSIGARRQRRWVLRQREFATNTGDLWRKVGSRARTITYTYIFISNTSTK